MNIFSSTEISRKICDFLREDLIFSWSCEHLRIVSLSIPVLGFERVCPGKVVNWSWPRIFFVCPWPRALCPRLHLWEEALQQAN